MHLTLAKTVCYDGHNWHRKQREPQGHDFDIRFRSGGNLAIHSLRTIWPVPISSSGTFRWPALSSQRFPRSLSSFSWGAISCEDFWLGRIKGEIEDSDLGRNQWQTVAMARRTRN
jgi:hypothetical protein